MGKLIRNGITYAGSASSAKDVPYSNTLSQMTATNVQDAIDELAPKVLASVTADGVETYETILNRLYGLVSDKLTGDNFYRATILQTTSSSISVVYKPTKLQTAAAVFHNVDGTSTSAYISNITLKASGSSVIGTRMEASGNTVYDHSSSVPNAGTSFKIVLN